MGLRPKTKFENEQSEDLNLFSKNCLLKASDLLSKTVSNQIIVRLKENNDISKWVEQGLIIHRSHNSSKCEFCDSVLLKEKLDQLYQHFNDEDKKLKLEVDNLIKKIDWLYRFIETTNYYDKNLLYDELREEYQKFCVNFDLQKSKLLEQINQVKNDLYAKVTKTTEVIKLNSTFNFSAFDASCKNILNISTRHNKKTADFENEKNKAKSELKNHFLSTVSEEVMALEIDIKNHEEELKKILDGDSNDLGINALNKKISDNRIKISTTHQACEHINKDLEKFLGRNQLVFMPNPKTDLNENVNDTKIDAGYIIKRGDQIVTNLSESEKTAIGFVYFITHLKEKEFKINDGIIVLDDPISSLDSDLLFKTFSFIEMKLKTAGQLFILTHNYDFLNQLKKWFINEINSDEDITQHKGEFFMITNNYDITKKYRVGVLSEMDELIKNYESEYHYLFKQLLLFQEENPINQKVLLKTIYNYPNLARKLLECFLSFRVPKKANFYSKLMSLKELNPAIKSEEIGYVYSFVNSHSHLDSKSGLVQFDPTLTLNGTECVSKVLKLIEHADSHHYKCMVKVTKSKSQ